MSFSERLTKGMSKRYGGLELWIVMALCLGALTVLSFGIMRIWFMFLGRSQRRRSSNKYPHSQIPNISKLQNPNAPAEALYLNIKDKWSDINPEKPSVSHGLGIVIPSPLIGLPDVSHHGWGHWFTLRELDYATNRFSPEFVIGEGGYGAVYKGRLVNGTEVAVKMLLNDLGPAEEEFRAEVEAISHVRHKNLIRLLGYCVEGVHRMLVYEYVNNGNLEQWLHGAMRRYRILTWEARMKILLGTANVLAYLHEAIEPKVVHGDINSSNILIDHEFNSKVSGFGLAKRLDSGESHVTTGVMGTMGYVAPEYANSGLLNEKSDIYSFGVLLLEAVTGRVPVDYGRPANEVDLVEWLRVIVGNGRAEEVVDPNMQVRPTTRSLGRTLLVGLRCVDPDSERRPTMSQVVQMLEDDEFPHLEDQRSRRSRTASMEIECMKESSSSSSGSIATEIESKPG